MIILTIDTDWAPDHATKVVLDKVRELGVKTTVFFSTPSPVEYWPELEAGCHPDLSRRQAIPGDNEESPLAVATHGHDLAVEKAEETILKHYKSAINESMAVRTHRFYWHSDLSRLMTRCGFTHDSSMILPYHPGLTGFKVGKLYRWPVWASDHLHLARRLPFDRLDMPNWAAPGLKIFCFHVAYLYLNANNLADFNMIKEGLPDEAPPTASGRPGTWNLFKMLANEILKTSKGHFLSELPAELNL
ncbi:hypothetical protein C4J81_14565 [Deltaproteobacteria bacterium Smac51]|nr:hypothetical protein C4J81_14565 [Deltaproteobacteria bacterium Smac51]